MSDMISRADAIAAIRKQIGYGDEPWMNGNNSAIAACVAIIRALSAAHVAVKPLEWVDFHDRGAKAQAWNDANYMIQKWIDGRWEISASYPGYSTSIYGVDRFHPTLASAKAAAQADHEARIRSALTAAPAPDPAQIRADAMREAARTVWSEYDEKDASYWGESHGDIARREKARAILAKLKGGA